MTRSLSRRRQPSNGRILRLKTLFYEPGGAVAAATTSLFRGPAGGLHSTQAGKVGCRVALDRSVRAAVAGQLLMHDSVDEYCWSDHLGSYDITATP